MKMVTLHKKEPMRMLKIHKEADWTAYYDLVEELSDEVFDRAVTPFLEKASPGSAFLPGMHNIIETRVWNSHYANV